MNPNGGAHPTRKVDLTTEFVRDFRSELRRAPLRARDADEALASALRGRGFRVEGGNLRAVQAPYLLTPGEVRGLTRDVRALSALLEQVVTLALNSVAFMEQIGVPPNVEELAVNDAPSRRAIEFARYDFLPTPSGPRFLEFNVDSPAGAAFSNVLDSEFQRTEPARAVGLHTLFPSAPPIDLYVDALLAAYSEHDRATETKPNVAVVDFSGASTLPEQQIVVEAIRARGLKAELLDPREFDYRSDNRGLYSGGERYHLVCRRALVPELARRRVLVAPFLRGLQHGEVVVVNPLRSRLAGNKGVLEILTSAAFERFFTPAENQIKLRILPWTRKLKERMTDYMGREVDLLPYVASRPERFVLKPGGGFGGQGVVLGPFCDRNAWLRRLDEAVNTDGVVQEYVPACEHDVPNLEGNQVVDEQRYLTLGAYAIRGEYAGCIGRVSQDPVVNVRRGGAVVPVLEVGGRSKTGPLEAARPRRRRTTGHTGAPLADGP
jgi:hypothetical protein